MTRLSSVSTCMIIFEYYYPDNNNNRSTYLCSSYYLLTTDINKNNAIITLPKLTVKKPLRKIIGSDEVPIFK
jgi:hypothetical protein